MDEKELWKKCAEFHGHECGGLTIGFKAALYAIELLDLPFSRDEQVVCITENDACGIDAIQVILGCSAGKGNLIFHMMGKNAYSFYNRTTGKSVRLVLKPRPADITKANSFAYYQALEPKDMFDIKETTLPLPDKALLFNTIECDCCHESVTENYIRLQEGKKLCLDCAKHYSRLDY